MICDPMQVAACKAIVAYCEQSNRSVEGEATPSSSGGRSTSCAGMSRNSTPPWLIYDLPWTVSSSVKLEAMEEDPDNRPYIWDLEED